MPAIAVRHGHRGDTTGVAPALVPLIVGLLFWAVAYGRWRLVPIFASSRTR